MLNGGGRKRIHTLTASDTWSFADVAGALTDGHAIRDGQLDEVTTELEELLGRRPASLETGLKSLFKLQARGE